MIQKVKNVNSRKLVNLSFIPKLTIFIANGLKKIRKNYSNFGAKIQER